MTTNIGKINKKKEILSFLLLCSENFAITCNHLNKNVYYTLAIRESCRIVILNSYLSDNNFKQ